MRHRDLARFRLQDRPHPVPGGSRLRDRRDKPDPLGAARAPVPREEQPPPFAREISTQGWLAPPTSSGPRCIMLKWGIRATGVIRRGHVEATYLSIGASVDHQVAAGSLHHTGRFGPVGVGVAGEADVDRDPQPFPGAARGMQRGQRILEVVPSSPEYHIRRAPSASSSTHGRQARRLSGWPGVPGKRTSPFCKFTPRVHSRTPPATSDRGVCPKRGLGQPECWLGAKGALGSIGRDEWRPHSAPERTQSRTSEPPCAEEDSAARLLGGSRFIVYTLGRNSIERVLGMERCPRWVHESCAGRAWISANLTPRAGSGSARCDSAKLRRHPACVGPRA